MAVEITIDFSKQMTLDADFDEVFDLVADVPKIATMFPKVDKIVELGDNSFRWEMEKTGVSKYTIQVIYACKYENDKEKGVINWQPVDGVGNGVNEGTANLKQTDNGTFVDFSTRLTMTLPLPRLAKGLVKPLIVREFNSVADKFEKNMINYFA